LYTLLEVDDVGIYVHGHMYGTWTLLEGDDVGVFHGHLVYIPILRQLVIFHGHFVYFVVICFILYVLVYCSRKYSNPEKGKISFNLIESLNTYLATSCPLHVRALS
jgi:hypothetical protein